MTNRTCPACSQRSIDGHLCHQCTKRTVRDLRELPWLYLETMRAVVGLVRLGSPVGGRGATTPLPVSLRASHAADAVRTGLVGWVRITHDDLGAPWPGDSITAMTRHLTDRMKDLRRHEDTAELVADVARWTGSLLAVINRPDCRRIPVGPCPLEHDGAPCEGRVWAVLPADPDLSPHAACDVCCDPDADTIVGWWEPADGSGHPSWATLGRQMLKRAEEVERQRKLAAEVLGRSA